MLSCAAEIRPAPHMDNVVNIYKSMKTASRTPVSITKDDSTGKLGNKEYLLSKKCKMFLEIWKNTELYLVGKILLMSYYVSCSRLVHVW